LNKIAAPGPIFRLSFGWEHLGQIVCEGAMIDSNASNSFWQSSQI
jgi:hypothetical protein